MTEWVPNWLSEVYLSALQHFPVNEFSLHEIGEKGVRGNLSKVALSRLAQRGWLDRVGRGSYRVIPPTIIMFEILGFQWRSKVPQRAYLPLLEFAFVRFLDGYLDRLRSLVLFGSVARGTARAESDVDLLMVADQMAPDYSGRVREALNILEGWESVKRRLWKVVGLSPNIDLLLLDSGEADVTHPFYLDLVQEGIVMYDRGNFMAERFQKLRMRLQQLGSVRIQRPDGKWYWILVPNAKDALTVEI